MDRLDWIRSSFRAIVAFGATFCTLAGAQPAWTPASAFGSMSSRAVIYAMAIDPIQPDHVYAGGGNQLFLSVDGGASFAPLPPVPATEKIYAVAVLRDNVASPPRLLVGTANAHVLSSPDGGITYVQAAIGDGSQISRIYGAAGSGSVAFAASGTRDMFQTDDGGATWRVLNMPPFLAGDGPTNLAVAPGGTVLYSGRSHGLYKSLDGGAHWTRVEGGLPVFSRFDGQAIAGIDSVDPRIVFAIIPATGIYRSDDGGVSWRRTGDVPPSFGDRLLVSGNMLFAGGYRSRDGGASWTKMTFPPDGWLVFERDPVTGRIFLGSDNVQRMRTSIARSLDDGDSWLTDTVGVGSPPARFLAADPGRGLYAVTQELSTVHALPVPEGAWRDVSPPLQNGGQGFVGPLVVTGPDSVTSSGPWFYRTANGGTDWIPSAGGRYTDPRLEVQAFEPGNASILYGLSKPSFASGNSSAWSTPARSVDGGRTWTSIATGLPLVTNHLAATGNSRLVAGTTAGAWVSANAGASWRKVDGVAGESRAMRIRPDAPDTVFLLTDGGVHRSLDGGVSFSRVSDLPVASARHLAIGARLYLVTDEGDVYASDDEGQAWSAVGGPSFTHTPIVPAIGAAFRDVVVSPWSPGTLYAATTRGVLKFVARADAAIAQEFHHAAFDHYFVTTSRTEAAKLATAQLPGWRPTGRQFAVVAAAGDSGGVAHLPVCRFFSASFAPRSSHFYTPYADECAKVKASSAWTYEGVAFALTLPAGTPGARACPAGMQPLYRAYNDFAGGAPNHRYTIDPAILDAMVGTGWIMEGEAATRVFACVPAQD